MAKVKNTKGKRKGPKRAMGKKSKRPARFGPVTTISTAPVAIGNSVRGSQPQVTNSANGCRVIGRDFAFEAKATVAAANGWSLIGGMPLTPAVLATSSLRSYAQMFSNFKINRLVVHYITSSPTSQAGDIMFYYERERNSPMVDFTNSGFLPFVLSDPNTVIGPQWQNHSVMIDPVKEWKNTNYGLQSDLNEESVGSVFLFSKTNSASSPGYLLVDFDITFKEMCVNPRAGIIPITRGLWNYTTFGSTASAVSLGGGYLATLVGSNPDGTAATLPPGSQNGDIYKTVFLVTNSTVSGTNAAWTNVTTANLLAYSNNATTTPVTIDDGFTCYALLVSNTFIMYPSLEAAKTQSGSLKFGVTATITYALCAMVSLVATNNTNSQSAY
jgi:hypothetical protein